MLPAHRCVPPGQRCQDEIYHGIYFPDPADLPPCSDGSTTEFVNHSNGSVTPVAALPRVAARRSPIRDRGLHLKASIRPRTASPADVDLCEETAGEPTYLAARFG
jgi:hypothetical protein